MARFQPGQTGNPTGRPINLDKPMAKAQQLIGRHLPQLVEARLADALQGDKQAADTLILFFTKGKPRL